LRRGIAVFLCALATLPCALPAYALPPTLSLLTTDLTASPNEYVSLLVVAQDPDGDPLELGAENVPSWAQFWSHQVGSTYYAVIFGTPSDKSVGVYSNIRISAADGSGNVVTLPLEFTVGAPIITLLTPRPTAVAGEYFTFLASAKRADGGATDVHVENVPAWATAWTTYDGSTSWITLYGTPTAQDVGVYPPVRIVASVSTGTIVKTVEIPVAYATGKSWALLRIAPTQNEDGSPLLDLAGYRYYVWPPDATSPTITDVGLAGSPLGVLGMTTGLWKIALTAYNSARAESRLSPVLPLLVR